MTKKRADKIVKFCHGIGLIAEIIPNGPLFIGYSVKVWQSGSKDYLLFKTHGVEAYNAAHPLLPIATIH